MAAENGTAVTPYVWEYVHDIGKSKEKRGRAVDWAYANLKRAVT